MFFAMRPPRLRFYVLLMTVALSPMWAISKSTIEPCSGSDACDAMVGYSLYTDLKVSEVSALFQADPIAILTANAIDITYQDVENHILPSGLFLKIPVRCSCADGIRRSLSTRYRTRPSDSLSFIADSVYSGLVSADQIREGNGISDPSAVDAGQNLLIPLPCTCFNNSDNGLPTVYLSYPVRPDDSVPGIAAKYSTTITDIMNVNAMGSPTVRAGDILAIPLPACASSFPMFASDHGLIIANGSYAITASHCVQCSCGPGATNMFCTPASLAVSCSSMQCRNSNLMLGNFTVQQSSAGCNVTSCSYSGFVNGTILTVLSTYLQPTCPGAHKFPTVIPPPSAVAHGIILAPASSPSSSPHPVGVATTTPKSSVPSTILPNVSPSSDPVGAISSSSSACVSHSSYLAVGMAVLATVFSFYCR